MSIITCNSLKKSYGALQVLKGIDLSIEKGEIISIVGTSGAGKTTLLTILGTLDNADEGTLKINDQNLTDMNSRHLSAFRNKNIGFVFQFHHLLPEFNAIENVCIPAYIGGASKKETEARAEELLAMLGLAERKLHKPSELSGGEQQRVAVARAMINNPAVIFADEPSGNLDSTTSKQLHELFFQLRKDLGLTFVIVTHNEVLADMADRKLVMKDGVIE